MRPRLLVARLPVWMRCIHSIHGTCCNRAPSLSMQIQPRRHESTAIWVWMRHVQQVASRKDCGQASMLWRQQYGFSLRHNLAPMFIQWTLQSATSDKDAPLPHKSKRHFSADPCCLRCTSRCAVSSNHANCCKQKPRNFLAGGVVKLEVCCFRRANQSPDNA